MHIEIKGSGPNLLKPGAKRRRSKVQIQLDKQQELEQAADTKRKLEELQKLKAREEETLEKR